ncbi:MAG: Re/Si-specific NAD(P)(+) transhydrogenase subunit alpha [Bacteroidota bacterium]
MQIGILRETADQRVALAPTTVKKLVALGHGILCSKGAGLNSNFLDQAYVEAGAILAERREVLTKSDLIICIRPPEDSDLSQIPAGRTLIGLFAPYQDQEITKVLESRQLRAFSLDMVPRSSLAQSMDVLSSMASIAGYRAVLLAAQHLPRYFPMMITAAGTIKPAKVLVLGAGVAGLQAIATAKRLGAQVEASDVRLAAKEEVESLGAKFIQVEGANEDAAAGGYAVAQSDDFLARQRAEVQRRAAAADVVITTAQVRGRQAPTLLPTSTVDLMRPGSVVVDLAADTGGNCEITQAGKTIQHNGVTIIGDSNLAAGLPEDASTLFSNNVFNFLKLFQGADGWTIHKGHEILAAAYITPNLPFE